MQPRPRHLHPSQHCRPKKSRNSMKFPHVAILGIVPHDPRRNCQKLPLWERRRRVPPANLPRVPQEIPVSENPEFDGRTHRPSLPDTCRYSYRVRGGPHSTTRKICHCGNGGGTFPPADHRRVPQGSPVSGNRGVMGDLAPITAGHVPDPIPGEGKPSQHDTRGNQVLVCVVVVVVEIIKCTLVQRGAF